MTGDVEEPGAPVLRLVRGEATPEQLAAMVVVLAAATGRDEDVVPGASRWASPADAVRAPTVAGPDAWRTSAWPR